MTLWTDSRSNGRASVVLERLVDFACVAAFALVLARAVFADLLPGTCWAEATLLVALTVSLVLSTARSRSLQSAILAAIVIGTAGGWLHALGALAGLPFGQFTYGAASGPKLGGLLPWTIPLVWIVLVLSSRGAADFILRRRQGTPNYGLYVISLTVAMAFILEIGLEAFARKNGDWLWKRLDTTPALGGIPLLAVAGWLGATAVLLAIAMPLLLKKKPVKIDPDWKPLAIWLSLNVLFARGFL